jgi:hypothetical protein
MVAKDWYKSWTIWFGIVYTFTYFFSMFTGYKGYVPPDSLVQLLEQVAGLVVIVLRLKTSSSIKSSPLGG